MESYWVQQLSFHAPNALWNERRTFVMRASRRVASRRAVPFLLKKSALLQEEKEEDQKKKKTRRAMKGMGWCGGGEEQ